MTWYPRSAYGATNVNAGYPANGDFQAWGGWRWPDCPPASLVGTTSYASQTTGQTIKVQMRKELVPLWNLIFEIQDVKYHYPVWGNHNGEYWGPWGGACRPVAGTQRASGHSGWLSVDENAPNNPYSYTFQSDMPPAMVADMESLGLYWGGRYQGQKYDAMHYGFCRRPADVAGYITKAKQILAGTKPPQPQPEPPKPEPAPPEDDDMFATIKTPSAGIRVITPYVVAYLDSAQYNALLKAGAVKAAVTVTQAEYEACISGMKALGAFSDTNTVQSLTNNSSGKPVAEDKTGSQYLQALYSWVSGIVHST